MSISFRKEALEQLTTPEQLDQTVPILRPMDWLIAVVLLLALAFFATWSVLGEITKRVSATGLLISSEGQVFDAKSVSTGILGNLNISVGSLVAKNEVIGGVLQNEVQQQQQSAMDTLTRRKSELAEVQAQLHEEARTGKEFYQKNVRRLNEQVGLARKSQTAAVERLDDHKKLYEQKAVTRATLRSTQQSYDQTVAQLSGLINRLEQAEEREINRRHNASQRLIQARDRMATAQEQLAAIDVRLSGSSVIKAPVDGRVIEVKANIGSPLSPGMSIASIETLSEDLEMIGYVDPQHGKKVKVGQEVLVGLGLSEDASAGRLRGEVRSISEFPVTEQGIVSRLQNHALARSLTANGPPYEVRVLLKRDVENPSGYEWTSKKGHDTVVTSGSFCSAKIVYKKELPISLAIPLLQNIIIPG